MGSIPLNRRIYHLFNSSTINFVALGILLPLFPMLFGIFQSHTIISLVVLKLISEIIQSVNFLKDYSIFKFVLSRIIDSCLVIGIGTLLPSKFTSVGLLIGFFILTILCPAIYSFYVWNFYHKKEINVADFESRVKKIMNQDENLLFRRRSLIRTIKTKNSVDLRVIHSRKSYRRSRGHRDSYDLTMSSTGSGLSTRRSSWEVSASTPTTPTLQEEAFINTIGKLVGNKFERANRSSQSLSITSERMSTSRFSASFDEQRLQSKTLIDFNDFEREIELTDLIDMDVEISINSNDKRQKENTLHKLIASDTESQNKLSSTLSAKYSSSRQSVSAKMNQAYKRQSIHDNKNPPIPEINYTPTPLKLVKGCALLPTKKPTKPALRIAGSHISSSSFRSDHIGDDIINGLKSLKMAKS
ncbi:hypothetical protein DAMA08_005170 [Martiniozyma asiatica (nom. inval.)]|nr:hypothetical protein DAMA08_005170 [Martiniozyma asiatica]